MRNDLIALFALLIACGCISQGNIAREPILSYTVGPCDQDANLTGFDSAEIIVIDNSILIRHNLSYVCCADINIDYELNSTGIRIIERNEGQICRCMCAYSIEANLSDIPDGTYTVELYGVEYQNLYTPELIAEKEITIGAVGGDIEGCSLSLCDCKCYPRGETPEEKTGVLCGINCKGEFNVIGCAYSNGTCSEVFAEQDSCESDSDCIPAQCCHPTSCTLAQNAPDCSGIMCSQECANGSMDCGAGTCACSDGECAVEWSNMTGIDVQ